MVTPRQSKILQNVSSYICLLLDNELMNTAAFQMG